MKIMLSSTRRHYLKRLSIFLVMAALIAGIVGCDDGGGAGGAEITIISVSTTKTPIYVGDEFCITAKIKNTGNITVWTYNELGFELEPEDALGGGGTGCGCIGYDELSPGKSIWIYMSCCCPRNWAFSQALKAGPVTCTVTAGWVFEGNRWGEFDGNATKTFTFTIL